jgi:hypothetical protein
MYRALKLHHPELYRKAVEIGHIPLFVSKDAGSDSMTKCGAAVETAVIEMLFHFLNLELSVWTPSAPDYKSARETTDS